MTLSWFGESKRQLMWSKSYLSFRSQWVWVLLIGPPFCDLLNLVFCLMMLELTRSDRLIRMARGCKMSIPDGGFISAWWVILATLELEENSNGSWKLLLISRLDLNDMQTAIVSFVDELQMQNTQPKWRRRHANVLIPWLFLFPFLLSWKKSLFLSGWTQISKALTPLCKCKVLDIKVK